MPEWSRRHALHAVATAGSVFVAGCGASSRPPEEPPPLRDRVTEFETALARSTQGKPLVVRESSQTSTNRRTPTDRLRTASLVEHITDAADLDAYRFHADTPVAAVQSLVTQTDFDQESVYLLQRPIDECYRPRLVSVYREADGVDVSFCQELRPADAACDVETRDVIAVAIRLPFPGDEFNSLGTGWGGDCDRIATVDLANGSAAQ